jgi:hypothetical protein
VCRLYLTALGACSTVRSDLKPLSCKNKVQSSGQRAGLWPVDASADAGAQAIAGETGSPGQ